MHVDCATPAAFPTLLNRHWIFCDEFCGNAGRTRLASKIFTVTESWDVAAFLGRQFGFRWRWTSGMFVPHIMNRATCLLELTMLIVVIVTTWGRIQPASPANVLLACTFLLYYGSVIASGLATSQGFHSHHIGRLLTARILVPFLATVYSFAISRFGALPCAIVTSAGLTMHTLGERSERCLAIALWIISCMLHVRACYAVMIFKADSGTRVQELTAEAISSQSATSRPSKSLG